MTIQVYLTQKGRNLKKQLSTCAIRVNSKAMKNLTKKQRTEFIQLLQGVITNLSDKSS